ncbi:MAG: hypothetical protein HY904_21850 [Deltaproteobacteria bacterium]|nr:hypothetical protein [Deltaproteobacteria bacterium]
MGNPMQYLTMTRHLLALGVLGAMSLAGCNCRGPQPSPAGPTKAIVKLTTSGSLASGALIGGIDITVSLPAGVSVKATPDSVNERVLVVDPGIATASGVAAGASALAMGTYTLSTRTVALKVVNPIGFGTGEFATVGCDLASGTTVTAADFSAHGFAAVDLNGVTLVGLTPGVTVELQ